MPHLFVDIDHNVYQDFRPGGVVIAKHRTGIYYKKCDVELL